MLICYYSASFGNCIRNPNIGVTSKPHLELNLSPQLYASLNYNPGPPNPRLKYMPEGVQREVTVASRAEVRISMGIGDQG